VLNQLSRLKWCPWAIERDGKLSRSGDRLVAPVARFRRKIVSGSRYTAKEIEMNIRKSHGLLKLALVAALLIELVPAQPNAQVAPIEFRMIASKDNPSTCKNYDTSLSRVHALTMMGDRAIIKSSGGIDDTLKQTAPKVYKTTVSMGGVKFEVVVDASKNPLTVEVVKPSDGCRWSAGPR
jgi:hypothetical protein